MAKDKEPEFKKNEKVWGWWKESKDYFPAKYLEPAKNGHKVKFDDGVVAVVEDVIANF